MGYSSFAFITASAVIISSTPTATCTSSLPHYAPTAA